MTGINPLSGSAKLAGVMGWPVAHSLSPRLHGFWLNRYGIDGAYVPLAVSPEDLAETIRLLPKIGFRGVNLTLPHKETVLPLLDEISPSAARIGAVNTVVVTDDGALRGENTDGWGFIESLIQATPDWIPQDAPAVILGAGGAARSVAFALGDAGVPRLIVCNRTESRSEALVRTLTDEGIAAETGPWLPGPNILAQAGLLVNTTSLGMAGVPPLEISLDGLPAMATVADIVYTPLTTDLLHTARVRGHRTVDGLGMLLHQARGGFRAWFGTDPEVTEDLRIHVLDGLQGD